jgi:hypothetical protein
MHKPRCAASRLGPANSRKQGRGIERTPSQSAATLQRMWHAARRADSDYHIARTTYQGVSSTAQELRYRVGGLGALIHPSRPRIRNTCMTGPTNAPSQCMSLAARQADFDQHVVLIRVSAAGLGCRVRRTRSADSPFPFLGPEAIWSQGAQPHRGSARASLRLTDSNQRKAKLADLGIGCGAQALRSRWEDSECGSTLSRTRSTCSYGQSAVALQCTNLTTRPGWPNRISAKQVSTHSGDNSAARAARPGGRTWSEAFPV